LSTEGSPAGTASDQLVASAWTSAGNATPRRLAGRSPIELGERIRAVAATGWNAIALAGVDLQDADLDATAELVRELGLSVAELEFLTGWWQPQPAATRQLSLLRRAAIQLQASTIKASVEIPAGARQHNRLADRLNVLADVLQADGLHLALEPMANPESLSIAETVALIKNLARPTVGLCLDVLHARRSGLDDDAVARLVDVSLLQVVELSDATVAIHGDISSDSVDHRRLPGAGELEVAGFVRALRQMGYHGPWSVEILSREHRTLPLTVALTQARQAGLAILESPGAQSATSSPGLSPMTGAA
jgi:sugar phosphate isomerase/epimerase